MVVHLFKCGYPLICTKFSDCNFFWPSQHFNLHTFNCDWVKKHCRSKSKQTFMKQPPSWYMFSISFVNHFACFCNAQPQSLDQGKSEVFLSKNSHPLFIKMALVFPIIASSNNLVVSIPTLFVMFMINALHNSYSNPIWGRS